MDIRKTNSSGLSASGLCRRIEVVWHIRRLNGSMPAKIKACSGQAGLPDGGCMRCRQTEWADGAVVKVSDIAEILEFVMLPERS